MAERSLAENVAQVKADFKAIKDAVPYVFNDDTPTSEYGERIFTEISNLQYQADSAWDQGFNNGIEQGRVEGYENGKTDGITEGVEQGKQAQRLEWWGKYLGYKPTNRTSKAMYSAFGGFAWDDTTFDPPYDIFAQSTSSMFSYSYVQDLRGIFARNNVNIVFDESSSTYNQHFNVFANSKVKYLPYLKLPIYGTCYGWFTNCKELIEVDGYECLATHTFETSSGGYKTFQECTALEHIIFHGTIAKKLDIHWSKKLDRASILSLLTCLNATVSGITITLPSMCIDGATDTLALIQGDTELNIAYTQALANGYTITFA